MLPGSTKGGGQCLAFPDVCKTPAPPLPNPLPIPYPNMSMLNMATKTSTKVKFVSMEVVTMKSEIPSSNGDEAGVQGGMVSGKNLDKTTFKKGSSVVKIEGQPCVHLTSTTAQNGSNSNMVGGQIVPSQVKVLVGL